MEKFALITGASSGIGEATAKALAAQGFSLILVARRLQALEKLQTEIKSHFSGLRVIVDQLDVRERKQVDAFCQKHQDEIKNLEILVNNAGLAKGMDKFFEAKAEDWDEMIDTNIKGLLNITRAVLPALVAKKAGHIINIGSAAGRWVYPGGSVYCASKAAVGSITEGLRMDLLGKNIRVTNLEPGMVNTEFSKVRFDSQERADQVYAGMKPLTAEDIAETISWVISRPQHMNIQEMVIYPTDQASVRDVSRG